MNVRERSNWTNKQISYLRNATITEYDLASGGLSVIKEYKLLDQKYIDQLDNMDKEKKNVIIGKLQASVKNLAANMVTGFGLARQRFVDGNGIQDEAILSIKKDALFLITTGLSINGKVSDFLTFRPKNTYSSYIRLNNKEIYFSSGTKDVDIKGIPELSREKQTNYILKDVGRFLNQAEKIPIETLFENLKTYRSNYLNKNLPIETYRNLDTGLFSVNGFEMETIDETFKEDVDISYNYAFYIKPLIETLMNIKN